MTGGEGIIVTGGYGLMLTFKTLLFREVAAGSEQHVATTEVKIVVTTTTTEDDIKAIIRFLAGFGMYEVSTATQILIILI